MLSLALALSLIWRIAIVTRPSIRSIRVAENVDYTLHVGVLSIFATGYRPAGSKFGGSVQLLFAQI